jgi:hypothetical protein
MLNQEARKAGKYRDRIYGMNSSLFVNRGLPAFARATARQALIKTDQKGYCFGDGRRTHQSDK